MLFSTSRCHKIYKPLRDSSWIRAHKMYYPKPWLISSVVNTPDLKSNDSKKTNNVAPTEERSRIIGLLFLQTSPMAYLDPHKVKMI